MSASWEDLSDVELRRRLEQRGLDQDIAAEMVDHRDSCSECRAAIDRWLT